MAIKMPKKAQDTAPSPEEFIAGATAVPPPRIRPSMRD